MTSSKFLSGALGLFGSLIIMISVGGVIEFIRSGDWKFLSVVGARLPFLVLLFGVGSWTVALSLRKLKDDEALWKNMEGPYTLRVAAVILLLVLLVSVFSIVVLSLVGYDEVLFLPWVICVMSLLAIPVVVGWYVLWRFFRRNGGD